MFQFIKYLKLLYNLIINLELCAIYSPRLSPTAGVIIFIKKNNLAKPQAEKLNKEDLAEKYIIDFSLFFRGNKN